MHINDFVNNGHDGVTIAKRGAMMMIAACDNESEAVRMALTNLANDLQSVSGAEIRLGSDTSAASIVVGTIGTSRIIDDAAQAGVIDLTKLKDSDGRWRWEGYTIQTAEGKVWIAGTDRRGTIYGIYDFVEACGVSPWTWWADVPVHECDVIEVDARATVTEWPSVQYRGVFINDEEEFYDWAVEHTADGTIGPETYRKFFELVLRLKGNYVWPAMHVGAFGDDPRNGDLAERMGVVIGTTHCDMLMRSNQHEWDPWAKSQGEDIKYDYSLEGHNREKIQQYWREGVDRNRNHEVTWTVGMRGIHDTGFVTRAIDGDMHLSEEQKHRARVELLGKVIADQRQILHEEIGERADHDLQLFVPYKEVLPLYDDGLNLPEDIMILWANDNYGYMRRFPSLEERKRKGGHGLYYHSSYWAPTDSYLATSSTPLTLMENELMKSWDNGIRRMWIDNIGGLKPMEQEMEYFLYLAWHAGEPEANTDIEDYVAAWFDRTFSGGHGHRAARIYTRYYQLNNMRKPENLEEGCFSQTAYGDEYGRHVDELRELYAETNELWKQLPEREQDAFFELFAVKIHFSYLVNAQFYHADRSLLAEREGKTAAQDRHLALSRRYELQKRALIAYYNKHLANGKWDRMFTPDDFPPPATALNPAARPALAVGKAGLGVTIWGSDAGADAQDVLEFWPDGQLDKWIEIYSTGAAGLPFSIETSEPWIRVTCTTGVVDAERRIGVHVDAGDVAPDSRGRIVVHDSASGESHAIEVRVANVGHPDQGFFGSVEADGYVSIDPSRPDVESYGHHTCWNPVPYLGRFGNPAMEARSGLEASPADPNMDPAYIGYHIWLHNDCVPQLELHRIPTLDSTGRIRVGVRIDDLPIIEVETATVDEHIGAWETSKLDNIERIRTYLPYLKAGEHVIRLYVIDNYVTLDKIVLYTTARRASNLGPQFSMVVGCAPRFMVESDPCQGVVDSLNRDLAACYGLAASEIPLPKVASIAARYWNSDTTFKRFATREPAILGEARYPVEPDEGKNILRRIPSDMPVEHDGVLAFEAESALLNNASAWLTPALDGPGAWRHVQAETDGGTGLAMRAEPNRGEWNPVSWTIETAPRMNYRVAVTTAGRYHVWLYAEVDSKMQDMCWISVDGSVQPAAEHCSGHGLWAFGLRYIWHWTELSSIELSAGIHDLGLLAGSGGVRIDRVYLTRGDELPPMDNEWKSTV
ncbi:glycosyl hydrolase 115 family protein [Bifidobacterium scaligerum]|uniref:Gylcosyl hydrolase 115 C-terminal domain-containing protein n=1 Tax=Bifidobacterium scaligerum TaxID=2052656 RepID=A0A2M9HSC2_9BIFI|nr:glycosyl hydrolase 115 family protein [Bifidobacterium scaligerum]PJM79716.1 hypothetical protein CUU80_00755 [Bifidobacterium scaligerum]